VGSPRAAFLGGIVYAFFPQRMEQGLEHLNLAAAQFIPFAVWAFVRVLRAGGWRYRVALGVFFALNALVDWHLAVLLLLLLAALTLPALVRPPRARGAIARDLAVAGIVAAALTLPAAAPLLRAMGAEEVRYQKAARDRGVDAAFLLRPHPQHALLGALTRAAYRERRGYPAAGFICYLGVVPLALAVVGLARRPPGARAAAACLAVSLLLALGAQPWWNGRLHEEITLPFAWLEPVPVLGLMRIANRFLTLTSLALAVLAGFGAAALERWRPRPLPVALLLAVVDYLWLPYPVRDDQPSPLYARLREEAPAGAVLDLPFTVGPAAVAQMRAQTVHGRPIAGGYVSVQPEEPLRAIAAEPALFDLFGAQPPLTRPLFPSSASPPACKPCQCLARLVTTLMTPSMALEP